MSSTPDIEKRFVNVKRSGTFNRILDRLHLRDKKVLDLGCSYGEFLVCFGKDSLGITTTLAEVEYGKVNGIRIVKGTVERLEDISEIQTEQFGAVWANNLFEHLLAPHQFLNTLKHYANERTMLVLGVPVVPGVSLLMKLRKFRGALSVAHINFFTRKTLLLSVEAAGWKVQEARPFIFSNRWLDTLAGLLAPHIYIVAYNDVYFMYADKKLAEWKDEPHYAAVLRTTGQAK